MRLLDYFSARLIYLQSPLLIDECSDRINAAAGSVFNPFHMGVAGFVWMSTVRLRYRSALHEFGTTPVLIGRIDPMHGGTRLKLRFRAPMPAYFLAAFVVPMLLMMIWLAIVALGPLGATSEGGLEILAVAIVMVILPFLIFFIGSRNADAHRDALMGFLAQHVQARPLAEHLRPQYPRW
jgi:hypothetical protein